MSQRCQACHTTGSQRKQWQQSLTVNLVSQIRVFGSTKVTSVHIFVVKVNRSYVCNIHSPIAKCILNHENGYFYHKKKLCPSSNLLWKIYWKFRVIVNKVFQLKTTANRHYVVPCGLAAYRARLTLQYRSSPYCVLRWSNAAPRSTEGGGGGGTEREREGNRTKRESAKRRQ